MTDDDEPEHSVAECDIEHCQRCLDWYREQDMEHAEYDERETQP